MNDASTDVAIVGGGVIGCLVAVQLARRGARVTVLEAGKLGAQASSAATGLLAPYKPMGKQDDAYLALQRASLALFPALVNELEGITGLAVEYHETGTLRLVQEKHLAALTSWAALWSNAGVPMEVVQAGRLAALEPPLAPGYSLAVRIPGEPQVRAAAFTAAVVQAARVAGVRLLEGCQVSSIERSGARALAVRTTQGNVIKFASLVLAAGAWSGNIGAGLGLELPVSPVRGQSILLPQPARLVRHILFGEGVYMAPKGDMLIVGSTHEDVGFNCETTPDGIARLLAAARRLVPELIDVEVSRAWAGLRPRTPDSRPVLGRAPGWDNVALACGHNGFGVLLSPITAQTVAHLVLTGESSELIRPFGLDRFSPSGVPTAA